MVTEFCELIGRDQFAIRTIDMSDSVQINYLQRQLYDHLVKRNKITRQIADSQPTADTIDSIVPDAIRISKDDVAVAEAVASVTNQYNLAVAEEGVPIRCAGTQDNWILYADTICVVNPFDSSLLDKAYGWARKNEHTFKSIGVISLSYLSQLRAVHAEVPEDLDESVDEKLALQHMDEIIRNAAQQGASDIHFLPTQTDRIDLLYRVDGVLRVQRKIDLRLHDAMVRSVMETRCNVQLQSNTQQDGKFEFALDPNKSINLRVSTMPVVRKSESSLKMVMRLLGNNTSLAALDRLGLSKKNHELIVSMGNYPNGMIIMTGPTGSGKTTTLSAALLHMFHTNPSRNFHTIEDPVELQHEGMSHTEVTPTLSFAQALRALLRQDPDVILVGEMRDNETAELGYKAAMTGHLVLSTLHTNNSHESIGRLERMDIDREIIATNTTAFIAQRLLRALCPDCKQSYRLKDNPEQHARYGSHPAFAEAKGETIIYKANPAGCAKCGGAKNSGERGRRSIIEILEMTPEFQIPILQGKNPAILRREQIQNGTFLDLWDDGIRLIAEGAVGFDQVEAVLKPYEHDRENVTQGLGSGRSTEVKVKPTEPSANNGMLSAL